MRRLASPFVAVVVVIVATGALAACGSSSKSAGGSSSTITLYSGQHEQTTDKLVAAFEAESGIKVKVRSGDEAVLADQIATEGSHSPADVFFTENTPPLELLQEQGLLAPVDAVDAGRRAGQVQLAPGRLGGRVGPRQRDGLQHQQADRVAAPEVDHGSRGRRRGRASSASHRARPTSSRSSRRSCRRRARHAALEWLEGSQGERGQPLYPDNETLVAVVNKGQGRSGDQPLLLVPRARRGRCEQHALRDRVLRAEATRATWSTCPAPAVLESSGTRPRRRSSSPSS